MSLASVTAHFRGALWEVIRSRLQVRVGEPDFRAHAFCSTAVRVLLPRAGQRVAPLCFVPNGSWLEKQTVEIFVLLQETFSSTTTWFPTTSPRSDVFLANPPHWRRYPRGQMVGPRRVDLRCGLACDFS